MLKRTIISDIVQGIIIGGVLAFITAQLLMNTYVTKTNGWITMLGCGEPGNNLLFKAACANKFPAVNVPHEAVYWTTSQDSVGHTLSGQNNYLLHFPPGQLPPNNAFWSLTMGDAKNHFVPNPLNRYSVGGITSDAGGITSDAGGKTGIAGDRSSLVQNSDGSVDIYIQNSPPAGHESNWLPAPTGKFILWLRVYLPGQAILDGKYQVPPVVEVK